MKKTTLFSYLLTLLLGSTLEGCQQSIERVPNQSLLETDSRSYDSFLALDLDDDDEKNNHQQEQQKDCQQKQQEDRRQEDDEDIQNKKKFKKAWDNHLNLLLDKKQRSKLQWRIFLLNDTAKEKFFSIVRAIPESTPRKEFLEDIASFSSEDIKSLLNILLYLYDKDNKLILEICSNLGEVTMWEKIKFYQLEKKLPSYDHSLLDNLIRELQIPNS